MSADARRYTEVDRNLAANLREGREKRGLSQEELAQRMIDLGFGFSQATIWKIEQGKRPVKFSEALALQDVLQLASWVRLDQPPEYFRWADQIAAHHFRARRAYEAVKAAALAYLEAQHELSVTIHCAREAGTPTSDLLLDWIKTPGERAAIEARVEFDKEPVHQEEIDNKVGAILAALRAEDLEPFIEPDGWESNTPKPSGLTP